MQKNRITIEDNPWKWLGICLILGFVIAFPDVVYASDPFATLCDRVKETYDRGKQIVYVIAGIAALSLGVLAFFGRFRWTTFFAMVGGIFVIAIFDQILGFASNNTVSTTSC